MVDLLLSNIKFIEALIDNSYIKSYKNFLFSKTIKIVSYPNKELVNYFIFYIKKDKVTKIKYIIEKNKTIISSQIIVDIKNNIFLFKINKNIWNYYNSIIEEAMKNFYKQLLFKTYNLGIF